MEKRIKPAVKALIERKDKVLVLKTETENSVYWVLPGGKIEYGEEPQKTLKREINEELSTEVEIGSPVGMYHFFAGENNDGDQVVLTVFEGEIEEQEINISDNPADENITEYKWLKPEELVRKSSNEASKI
jgi:8-oxo-dGTP diphosphatase